MELSEQTIAEFKRNCICVIHYCNSLTQVINRFAKQLEVWLKAALEDTPLVLQDAKFDRKLYTPISISIIACVLFTSLRL